MRFLLLLILLLGSFASGASAQPAEAARYFDEGNRHYQAGAYQEALEAYEAALASGHASGALYLNMGNAYFRLDALGQAIRYYEKARRFLPDDPRLEHNLTVARARIETPISTLPPPVWRVWWERLVLRTGALPFFLAGLVFYGLAAGLFGLRLWTGTRNPWHRRALAASAGLALVLLVVAFGASLDQRLLHRAVVIAPAALHEAPEAAAPSALEVPEGVVVDILTHEGGWIEVRLPNGVTGWLAAPAAADV